MWKSKSPELEGAKVKGMDGKQWRDFLQGTNYDIIVRNITEQSRSKRSIHI